MVLTGEIFLLLWRHVPDLQKAKGFVWLRLWRYHSGSSSSSENVNRPVCHCVSARCTCLHHVWFALVTNLPCIWFLADFPTEKIDYDNADTDQFAWCTLNIITNHCVFAGHYDYWLPTISLSKFLSETRIVRIWFKCLVNILISFDLSNRFEFLDTGDVFATVAGISSL